MASTLLAGTGMRVGRALGLGHGDVVRRRGEIRVVPRTDNANGARAKTRAEHVIPVSAALIRLCSEYLHTEYGELGCDYVFVSLFAEPVGRPMSYPAVGALVRRLRAATGIFFTPHVLRHSHGSRIINAGVPLPIVQRLLGHASTEMTATYPQLHDATLRAASDESQRTRADITGKLLGHTPGAVTSEAEWLKHSLARVHDSLPNGYCGRPPQQDCPHPNTCLTCPEFQTTPAFPPVHIRQRDNTTTLIHQAGQRGAHRLAANHRKVLTNLENIIPALQQIEQKAHGARG